MNRLVYIGSGLDFIPVIIMNKIKDFVYIDSRPKSEYGMFYFEEGRFNQNWFLDDVSKIMKNNNFILKEKTEKYIEYTDNDKTIKYYINTPFPEMVTKEILEDIKNVENLYISGFDPNKIILKMLPNLKNIYCSNNTCYDTYTRDFFEDEEHKNNSLIHYLNENKLDFNFFLANEKVDYDYFLSENQKPEIKSNYDIIQIKNLLDVYNHKKLI